MSSYLVIKNGEEKKSYRCRESANKPYIKVSNSYLPLTTQTGTGLKVKINGSTYRIAESHTEEITKTITTKTNNVSVYSGTTLDYSTVSKTTFSENLIIYNKQGGSSVINKSYGTTFGWERVTYSPINALSATYLLNRSEEWENNHSLLSSILMMNNYTITSIYSTHSTSASSIVSGGGQWVSTIKGYNPKITRPNVYQSQNTVMNISLLPDYRYTSGSKPLFTFGYIGSGKTYSSSFKSTITPSTGNRSSCSSWFYTNTYSGSMVSVWSTSSTVTSKNNTFSVYYTSYKDYETTSSVETITVED